MKASDITQRCRDILQDDGADYWAAEELMRWLADGRLEAYALRPDLYETTEIVTLKAGVKQTLPNKSRWLFAVTRNVSSNKQRNITIARASELTRIRPNWRSMPPAAEVQHYIYDERDSDSFDVYPPARETVQVEISYAKLPEPTLTPDTELTQEGSYVTALIDYVLYRAFLKEADTVPAFHGRALQHYQVFQASLTGTVATKLAASPNSNG